MNDENYKYELANMLARAWLIEGAPVPYEG